MTSTTTAASGVPNEKIRPQPVVGRKMSPNSDSNYSFSDFFEKDKQPEGPSRKSNMEMDYISIDSSSTVPAALPAKVDNEPSSSLVSSSHQLAALPPPETGKTESEARIYLSKEHSKLLINEKGNKLLQELSKKYDVRVRLEWQAVGNLLTIIGTDSNQTSFHNQLTAFLKQSEDNSNEMDTLPMKKERMITELQHSIGCLNNTSLGNVYDLFRRQKQQCQGKRSKKEADKARRSLNMMLFGQAGFREGKRRLADLRSSLAQLKVDRRPGNVEGPIRVEILNNYRYIFTPFRHENYQELLQPYMAWRKQKNEANRRDSNGHRDAGDRNSSTDCDRGNRDRDWVDGNSRGNRERERDPLPVTAPNWQ